MKQTGQFTAKHEVCCSACGQTTPSYDIVNYGSMQQGYKHLCGQCFNQEIAKHCGLDFEHGKFTPVGLADCDGEVHEFHFRALLFGPGVVAVDGFELCDGHPAGYWFQVIGKPEDGLLVLLGRLIGRIRRALSTKHLKDGNLGLQIASQVVRGRIEWDDAHDGRLPMLIIDGREVTWEDFGHMLMSFEGFHFQLNIRDKGEER